MMLMPSQNSSGIVHYFAGKYPGKIGWLISPFSWKKPPWYMPYAIDNGSYTEWNSEKFMWLLDKIKQIHPPLWIVVPDKIGDCEITWHKWHKWHLRISPYGKLAFACQDGIEPQDVPAQAFCCFIGGTTQWKLKNAHRFKGTCQWLHIGRVNTDNRLHWAFEVGADSIDGSGWFRGNKYQKSAFIEYFEGRQRCLQF